jgi:AcrR family transcriptional regulator
MAEQPGPSARRSKGRRDHDRAAEPASGDDQSGLRDAILAATERLLAERSFADLAVSEILTAAGVSRGSFYFYFDSKHADPEAALRAGITAGAELWRASAPVLRAIVENWRTDPRLTALWLEQMQTFTDATVAQITADPSSADRLAGQDVAAVASALTWLGERLYYLAAIGSPPFDDQDTLVETLLFLWKSALGGRPGPVSR